MSGAVTTRNTPLSPTTFAEAERFAQMMAESTMVPPDFRGKPANIMFAMQFGAELGLSPLQSLQSISNINGKWAVYGDALLAIVLASPLCEDVIERLDGEDDNLRAICEARRRGAAPKIQMFSVADAKKASLWGKQGPWTQYPRRMLQWRARGFALRDAFPDLLRGVITVEEARDIPESGMVDVTPPSPEPLGADLDAFAAPAPEPPPHDPVTGEVLEPHALPGSLADYHPTQWGEKFIRAFRTSTTQAEGDAWVMNNAGILDDMQEHFPRAWLSIDKAIAAHRASLGPDEPELPGAA
jgi:hypothetical protein